MNVEIGTEAALFPEKEYNKWDFHCSVEFETPFENKRERYKFFKLFVSD